MPTTFGTVNEAGPLETMRSMVASGGAVLPAAGF